MSLPFNTPTAFNLQSNRNGIIAFAEPLRKNLAWILSNFVKIQKFSSRIVQECVSLHILEQRVCRANTLLHRTIAIRGDSAMYVLVHCLATRFANRKSRFCLILPPSLADMHTLYSKTRAPPLHILPVRFRRNGRHRSTMNLPVHC